MAQQYPSLDAVPALALGILLAGVQPQAWAQDEATALPFKFTTGLYQLSGASPVGGLGLDMNLRHSADYGSAWLGWYRQSSADVQQTRLGWDGRIKLGPVRLLPSLQTASGGFWGGSLMLETGNTWYAGLGLGRTNLRPYVNLNFDPNDAWMLGAGYRWSDGSSLGVLLVRDNRLNPDQQHLHLVYRLSLPEQQRLTLDVLSKRGLVDGAPVQRLGLSLAYDWPRYFVRLAYDPQVNFSSQNMWRLSVGSRF